MKTVRIRILATAMFVLAARLAGAQTPAAPAAEPSPAPRSESKWELEVHLGRSNALGTLAGDASLPSTGALSQGTINASTFYFGTATSLFNANQATLGLTRTMSAIDSVLGTAAIRRANDVNFGVRLQRAVTPRFAVEGAADVLSAPLAFQSSALATIEASRSSYQQALESVFSRSRLASAVTSVSTVTDTPSAKQVIFTGAAVWSFTTGTAVRPYVLAGGGMLFNSGTLPTAKLAGTFSFGDAARVAGTDTVTLNFTQESRTPVYLGGGGAVFNLTPRLGVRVDARLQLFKNSLAQLVDVEAGQTRSSDGAAFPTLTAGTFQVSPFGPLNGTAFSGEQTFSGSGLERRIIATVGVVLHF